MRNHHARAKTTARATALSRCSYNGECNADQTCTCSQGYSGVDCSLFNCSQVNNCSNAGTCVAPDVCACDEAYDGPACAYPAAANENAPQFVNTTLGYQASLSEYLPLNSFVLSVNATDKDSGRNGLVKYLIQPVLDYKYFSVEATSGRITLAAYLYTALSDALTFRVQAYDQGTPRLAATAQVSITIVRAKLSSTCDDIVSSSVTRYVIALSRYEHLEKLFPFLRSQKFH